MNPHETVHPTPDREQDFREILEDFDRHCHDRLAAQSGYRHLDAPIHLLTEEQQRVAEETQFGTRPGTKSREEFKGA